MVINRRFAPDFSFETNPDPVGTSKHGPYTASETQGVKLGTICRIGDRWFVYCKDNGSGLTAGYLVGHGLSTFSDTNLPTQSGTAFGIGQNVVTVTSGGSAITADQYANGYMLVISGTGAGQPRRIRTHDAVDAATAFNITLYDGMDTALDTTSDVIIYNSTYHAAVFPIAGKVKALGVPLVDVTADYYFWAQFRGPCMAYCGASITAGTATRALSPDTTTAGELKTAVAGEEVVAQFIQSTDGANATMAYVNLTIGL